MNMIKKNGGFTLVELIVVIAILAILAGVAVPAYTGYINKAKEAADLQALSAVYTAAAASIAATGDVVESISVDSTGVSVNGEAANADFTTYLSGTEIPAGLDADWADGTWTINTSSAEAAN